METKKEQLIHAIRSAADKIADSAAYEWGHMGRCNCGHLARELTPLSDAEIQRMAMEKHGDWAEQVLDFCPGSGLSMDWLISELCSYGLSHRDLIDLERLANAEVLDRSGRQNLRRNEAADVSLYMHTWAEILEEDEPAYS
jgi:hypothetical protein